jgi:hypothetical protein
MLVKEFLITLLFLGIMGIVGTLEQAPEPQMLATYSGKY